MGDYDLYKDDQKILERASAAELKDKIGIPERMVIHHVAGGMPYHGYSIRHAEIKTKSRFPQELLQEWDRLTGGVRKWKQERQR